MSIVTVASGRSHQLDIKRIYKHHGELCWVLPAEPIAGGGSLFIRSTLPPLISDTLVTLITHIWYSSNWIGCSSCSASPSLPAGVELALKEEGLCLENSSCWMITVFQYHRFCKYWLKGNQICGVLYNYDHCHGITNINWNRNIFCFLLLALS